MARALPVGSTPEQRRMGLRYVLAGIESAELKNAIADEANDGPSAWQFIADEFLHGRDEQTILHELLSECNMAETGKTALTYRFEFQKIAKALMPPLPDDTLCTMFASKIPGDFDSIVCDADINPGRSDYQEYIRAVSQRINSFQHRQRSRENKISANEAKITEVTNLALTELEDRLRQQIQAAFSQVTRNTAGRSRPESMRGRGK